MNLWVLFEELLYGLPLMALDLWGRNFHQIKVKISYLLAIIQLRNRRVKKRSSQLCGGQVLDLVWLVNICTVRQRRCLRNRTSFFKFGFSFRLILIHIY